ncbi:MAG: CDC27 family protein [Bacteroidota bacterium]
MKNINQNINSNLSRKDISQSQKSDDISTSEYDDFDKDALNGWKKNNSSFSLMKSMDSKYLMKGNFILKYTIYISVLIVAFYFIYDLASTGSATYNLKGSVNVQSTNKTENKKTDSIYLEKTDLKLSAEIKSLKPIAKKKQIVANEIKRNFSSQKEEEEIKAKTDNTSVAINTLPFEKIESNNIAEEKSSSQLKRINKAQEVYIADLLTVDYRKYRNKPSIKVEQIILTGVSADLETSTGSAYQNQVKKINEKDWKTVDISYINYITKTMELFSAGKYKKSITRFEEILKAYPQDLNANFYGGLCYYNLGEFQKSREFFKKCLSNEFTNFNEDAAWYISKTYIATKDVQEARNCLNEIILEGGFYSEQARKVLGGLK